MDFRIDQWINAPAGHTPVLDPLMIAAAVAAVFLFVAGAVLWFVWGWWRRSESDREGALAAATAAVVGLAINFVIGALWDRPRPFVAHPGQVHELVTHAADASFPSDHAVVAFAVAVVLVAFHRRWGTVALLLATLVCYARVYVGDHYPSDVLAGAAIGTILAVLLLGVGRGLPVLERRVADALFPPRFQRLGAPAAASATPPPEREQS